MDDVTLRSADIPTPRERKRPTPRTTPGSTPTSSPASPARPNRLETPGGIPLWRDVIIKEEALRPEVAELERKMRRPVSKVLLVGSLVLVLLGAVAWSLELQRRARILELDALGPRARGQTVPGFLQYPNWGRTIEAWPNIAGSLGSALLVWLIVLAVPSWRRFARRRPAVPAAIGVALYLTGMMIYTALMV